MEKPPIKDKEITKYVEYLEKRLENYEKSPYMETYLTLKTQIVNFNKQLTSRNIDLFSDKEDKSFDRTKWYFDNMLNLNKQMDDIRKLMTPQEQKELAEKEKINKAGLAERIALGLHKENVG